MSHQNAAHIQELEARSAAIDRLEDGQVALARRQALIEDLTAAGEPARLLLARNHMKLAVSLRQAGEVDAAVTELRMATSRFGDLVLPNGRSVAAEGLWLIALYCLEAGSYEETVAVVETLVRRFGGAESDDQRIASALINKGRALWALKRPEEQLETLWEVIAQFGSSRAPEVRQLVALAMFQRGAVFKALGALEEALNAWGQLFDVFGKDPPHDASQLPFQAQAAKVETLVDERRIAEARTAAEALIATMRGARRSVVGEIGAALIRCGRALERAGELPMALEAFECASERLLGDPDDDLKILGVHAQINVGVVRGRRGDERGALTAMEAIVSLGAPALVALDSIIKRAGESSSGVQEERGPWALLLKGLVLEHLGRVDEANGSYAQVVERFSANDSATVELLVTAARDARARLSG